MSISVEKKKDKKTSVESNCHYEPNYVETDTENMSKCFHSLFMTIRDDDLLHIENVFAMILSNAINNNAMVLTGFKLYFSVISADRSVCVCVFDRCRAACLWTASLIWTTVTLVCWRLFSSPCLWSHTVRRRRRATPSSA